MSKVPPADPLANTVVAAGADSPPAHVGAAAETEATPPRRFTRRRFLMAGAAATGAAVLGGGAYLATRRAVNVAILGAGLRGSQHASMLKNFSYFMNPYGRVVAICDAELSKAQNLCQQHWPSADSFQDYRDVLARDDVEAVIICPCDHWHAQMAIDAMHAGKAVYGEKPLTLTVAEGERLVQVAEETRAVFQVGTQQRSQQTFRTACELLRNGRLGKLRRIVVTLDEQTFDDGVCRPDAAEKPDDLDWDLWLGPTELIDYCRQRHRSWGNWFDYSGGEVTGWGSHHLDIGLWGMGGDFAGPVRIDGNGDLPGVPGGYDVPRTFHITLEYPNGVQVVIKTTGTDSRGVLFEGTEGRIFANRGKVTGKPVEDLATHHLPADAVRMSDRPAGEYGMTAMMWHYINFFECIDTGEQPIADVQSAHRVMTALHLSNISIRLGRPLEFDPDTREVVGDEEAAAMLERPRRDPYLI